MPQIKITLPEKSANDVSAKTLQDAFFWDIPSLDNITQVGDKVWLINYADEETCKTMVDLVRVDLVTADQNPLLERAVLEVVETNGFAARDELDNLLGATGRNLSFNPTIDDDKWVVRQTSDLVNKSISVMYDVHYGSMSDQHRWLVQESGEGPKECYCKPEAQCIMRREPLKPTAYVVLKTTVPTCAGCNAWCQVIFGQLSSDSLMAVQQAARRLWSLAKTENIAMWKAECNKTIACLQSEAHDKAGLKYVLADSYAGTYPDPAAPWFEGVSNAPQTVEAGLRWLRCTSEQKPLPDDASRY